MSIALFICPPAYAVSGRIFPPLEGIFKKATNVKFGILNRTGTSIDLMIGDRPTTLKPGERISLNLPVGTRIITKSAGDHYASGDLIEEVIKDHEGATIVIN
jgi:hypothetical protein